MILATHLSRRIFENVNRDSPNEPVDLARLFAALADPTRLRLLHLMDGAEVCVCYFVEILGQSQPKISRHLAYLRNAGIVRARREGKWMHYRIERPADAGAAAILDAALEGLRSNLEMRADSVRLKQACCEPQRFVSLRGAPLPGPVEATSSRPEEI
jgi:ArsR family transcriptional regulator